jgi:hypothetical protein
MIVNNLYLELKTGKPLVFLGFVKDKLNIGKFRDLGLLPVSEPGRFEAAYPLEFEMNVSLVSKIE